MTHDSDFAALSVSDRASLSLEEEKLLVQRMHRGDQHARSILEERLRRQAAWTARRVSPSPALTYDLYLAGLLRIRPFLKGYHPGDTMGISHAFSWLLRQTLCRAMACLPLRTNHTLPSTVRRVLETGRLI